MIWEIFITGIALEVLFLRWYFNWKGPMTKKEIEDFMEKFPELPFSSNTDAGVIRQFLEEDNGKDFCMANFITLNKGKVKNPVTGESQDALSGAQSYMKQILPTLLKHGCHPVQQAYRVGGHIDTWGTEDKMEFPMLAMVRWRSRRDFAKIVAPSRPKGSKGALETKVSSMKNTLNVPIEIKVSLFMRPQYSVPLLILLMCCIAQIALTTI
ncbi:hypothetical protein [Glaciecola petra]|uniref:Uncharacterized protein n=1 Tax=Glaciecola petra TaxID=3075602 RepID=A0ABU2ZV06_9ALTE|nr:hypothetical protein [Aestuariibacter sp. P117]MDT0596478.1 hypothetical protein [Aestuariibacter sp. P117]